MKPISQRNLQLLARRKLTKRALAASLGLSEAYLSRNTPNLPKGPTRAKREAASLLAEARRKHRLRLAKQVVGGRLKLETAAVKANCSLRTMYRYTNKVST